MFPLDASSRVVASNQCNSAPDDDRLCFYASGAQGSIGVCAMSTSKQPGPFAIYATSRAVSFATLRSSPSSLPRGVGDLEGLLGVGARLGGLGGIGARGVEVTARFAQFAGTLGELALCRLVERGDMAAPVRVAG